MTPVSQAHPTYRPDIDGLRAVAVLSVVGFHAFPGTVKGGFVGVDVFFIISGFLISTILFGNLARNSFDLLEFYVRRVRRIFPALAIVLLATFAFGWFSLMADEFGQLGKHVAAGAGFVSNLVFWGESGYFDTVADTKPLLHLWSLGVEEQFYIAWPLILLVAWRLRFRPLLITLGIALLSFAYNIEQSRVDPTGDFFSPATRFWEISLGSLLAYANLSGAGWLQRMTPRQRDIQSLAGASLLLIALLMLKSGDVFPGWWALLPTIGAALLIAAGSQAWVNRHVLARKPLVVIGLISFPLYLWHWPILSFIRILHAERPGRTVRVVAVLAAVALAWLTYRLVETPIRRSAHRRGPPLALVVAMVILGVTGYACYRDDGFSFRSAGNAPVVIAGDLGQEAFYAYSDAHFALCEPVAIREEAEQWDGSVRCRQSRPGATDLAIIGDSHAEHLFVGLAEALPARNVVYYTRSTLPTSTNPAFAKIFKTVTEDSRVRTVIISAWWALRFNELPVGAGRLETLQSTIDPLIKAGKAIYIVDDVPNFSFSPRLCKYGSNFFRRHRCTDDASFYQKQLNEYAGTLADLAKANPAVTIIRMSPYFCDEKTCSMIADGQLLFRDSDHMSIAGSQYAGKRVVADHPELTGPVPH